MNPNIKTNTNTNTNSNHGGAEYPTQEDKALAEARASYFTASVGTLQQKLDSPMKYMTRQHLAKLLCYSEVFRATSGVSGSILECGVYFGNGLLTWAKLSAALEPYNYNCKVIGFDTFAGNTQPTEEDATLLTGLHNRKGGYSTHDMIQADLHDAINVFDSDRPLNRFQKLELVQGDLSTTSRYYVDTHPELLVRILSLSVNLYEPTREALKAFMPRIPKGGAIVLFTLNNALYPGATTALLHSIELQNVRVITPPYYPNFNYILL